MRDYKDKHWDERFEQFKLAKEKRRQASMRELGVDVKGSKSRGDELSFTNSIRKRDISRNEARTYVNRGPSRFVRAHSSNIASHQQPRHQQVSHTPAVSEEKVEVMPQVEGPHTSFKTFIMEILPYLFILFGIGIAILFLTNKL